MHLSMYYNLNHHYHDIIRLWGTELRQIPLNRCKTGKFRFYEQHLKEAQFPRRTPQRKEVVYPGSSGKKSVSPAGGADRQWMKNQPVFDFVSVPLPSVLRWFRCVQLTPDPSTWGAASVQPAFWIWIPTETGLISGEMEVKAPWRQPRVSNVPRNKLHQLKQVFNPKTDETDDWLMEPFVPSL